MIDCKFPVYRHDIFCGAQPKYREIWVMLLEKAWAKVFGSYDNVFGGNNDEGLTAISGAPSIVIPSKNKIFLNLVEKELQRKAIVNCVTSFAVKQMTEQQQ